MARNNLITLRNGTTVPAAANFNVAEPAWDKTNGNLYIKDAAGNMVHINSASAAMPAYTLKGNNTGSSAAPANLTVAQARAMLRRSKQTLIFNPSQDWDLANGLYFDLTVSMAFTLNWPSNAAEGETAYMIIRQSAGGSQTISFAAGFKFAGGTAPVLTTTDGAADLLHFFFISTTAAYVTIAKDFK